MRYDTAIFQIAMSRWGPIAFGFSCCFWNSQREYGWFTVIILVNLNLAGLYQTVYQDILVLEEVNAVNIRSSCL